VLLTRTSKRYFHNDVRQLAASGWGVSQMTGPLAADGLYGLGATTFRARGKGAFAKIATADKGTFGRHVSLVAVPYLQHPGGGGFEILIDGVLRDTVVADGETKAALAEVRVPDAEHTIEIRSTAKDTRIFGVWLERGGPGVVLDAVGVTNSKIRYLLRTDEAFMAKQIAQRGTDLLMFNFGVNGAREGEKQMGGLAHYESSMRELLQRMRKNHPNVSCLVVAPGDAAAAIGTSLLSFPLMTPIVEIQGRVAVQEGCAFWNMRAAMGGDGSMGKWRAKGLGEEDMLHPTNAGATLLGNWLYLALMERFTDYRRRQTESVKTESR
jgi:lysophospholipase L1-like esterase